MAQLRREVKIFIVRSLAVFNTPSETAQAVKERFGIVVTPQKCEAYDPTKRTGQDLSQPLKDEFLLTRKAFNESPQDIPIANKSYRLQQYQNELDAAGKNKVIKLKILEQAAKETGDYYVNHRSGSAPTTEAQPVAVTVNTVDASKPNDGND